tara:strand:+ start:627 stop:1040 length:414 start_codon:yes stop_codon:yes gene_type:complete
MKALRTITLPATLTGALALAACGAEEKQETVKAPVAEKTYDVSSMSDAEKDVVMEEFKDAVGTYAMICTGRVNKENPIPETTGNERADWEAKQEWKAAIAQGKEDCAVKSMKDNNKGNLAEAALEIRAERAAAPEVK